MAFSLSGCAPPTLTMCLLPAGPACPTKNAGTAGMVLVAGKPDLPEPDHADGDSGVGDGPQRPVLRCRYRHST
jgi:hypothetical protein